MKKFKFSLAHMLDLKDHILDEEQAELQRRKAEVQEIQNQIDYLDGKFSEISKNMKKSQSDGVSILQIRAYNMQLDNIRHQLKFFEEEKKKADKKAEDQTQRVISANQEVSKLSKLEDRQYEAYKHEEQKEEELRIEELVSQRLVEKRKI